MITAEAFSNYFSCSFRGHATRREWWFFKVLTLLFAFVVGLLIGMISINNEEIGRMALISFYVYCTALNLSLGARRLRDTGSSLWLLLFMLIPIFGTIILTIVEGFYPSETAS